MAHTLITIAMFTVIIIPVIMIGIADAKRHPWKPTNKHKHFGVDSDYMKAVKGGSKALAEHHRHTLMGK